MKFIEVLVLMVMRARIINTISNHLNRMALAARRRQIGGQVGHTNNGVQLHSAGPVFPMVIRHVGNAVQAMDPAGPCGPLHHYDVVSSVSNGRMTIHDSIGYDAAYAAAVRDARTMLACGS